jgi:hypothetical protein
MSLETRHVVMFSGGIASWATARIVAAEYGTDNLFLVFSDVKGNSESPHIGEDEDTYKFIDAVVKKIGGTYVYLNEGRDIWEVFKDAKFLGNSRIAKCSHELKQKPAWEWVNNNCDPKNTIIYVGIDWTEIHRLPAIEKNYSPYVVKAPLTEPPYIDKDELIKLAEKDGLPIPKLYTLGFPHNNCGGGCVRAGHGQFKKLLQIMPERYAVWEQKEEEVRQHIGKDVSILNDRSGGGPRRPLTLAQFRNRVENQIEEIDELDIGGCGCFFEDVDADE